MRCKPVSMTSQHTYHHHHHHSPLPHWDSAQVSAQGLSWSRTPRCSGGGKIGHSEKEEMEQRKQQKNKGRWCKILCFSHIHISTEAKTDDPTTLHLQGWFTDRKNTSYYDCKQSKIFSIDYFCVKKSNHFSIQSQITWVKLFTSIYYWDTNYFK